MAPLRGRTRWLATVFAGMFLTSCRGCDEPKPYTPFGVASLELPASAGQPGEEPGPQATAEPQPTFSMRSAVIAPKDASEWALAGQVLRAPEGLRFHTAVVADFETEEKPLIVAWLRAAEAGPLAKAAGEPREVGLWLFGAAPTFLGGLPGAVPSAPGCEHDIELSQTGPQTLTLDVRARCSSPRLARTPTRAVRVLRPMAGGRVVLELHVAEPAAGESLELAVVSVDRDADGVDDVRVDVTLGVDGQKVTAPLVWLDRASGPARDPEEPQKTLLRLASQQVTRAKGANTAKGVAGAVGAIQRYVASVCAEAAVFRLTSADGSAIRCGAPATLVTRLTEASVTAALKQKDHPRAWASIESASWFLGGPTPSKLSELIKAAKGALNQRESLARALDVQVARGLPAPRFSPLAFDADGDLLVLGPEAVTRLAPNGLPREPEDELPPTETPWPLPVVGPDRLWTGVAFSCDRSELLLTFTDRAGTPLSPIASPILSPRPGACAGAREPSRPTLSPLGYVASELAAVVGGHVLVPKGKQLRDLAARPGGPLSPDGEWLAVPTQAGLLLAGKEPELWLWPEAVTKEHLSDCVVANERARAACLRNGKQVLLLEPQGALVRSK